MRQIAKWCAFVCVGICTFLTHADVINYGYDESGRLIQVQTTAGSGQYRYDDAGNLTQVTQTSTSMVAIADVTPNIAPVGSNITITGSGFSSATSNDTVSFNGTVATVVSASATSLVVTVPTGASSGKISVTNAGSTATTASNFTIIASDTTATPTEINISTQIADPGASVTVAGTNFVGSGADLWVRVNGQLATITNVTSTQITFTVPTGATSGKIVVGTRTGEAVSSGYLFIPPTNTGASSTIGVESTITVDGASVTATVPAGKGGVFVFDGQKNQTLGLGISGVSNPTNVTSAAITIYSPDGTVLITCPLATASGNSCDIPTLPTNGAYAIYVSQPSYDTSLTLTLSNDIGSALTSTPQNYTINRFGQNVRLTFQAVAGSNYSVNWSGATIGGGASTIQVFMPDGTLLPGANTTLGDGTTGPSYGSIDIRNLPVSGTYTAFISPYGISEGNINVALNATGSLVVDGASTTGNLLAGQNGYYTFYGAQGQNLGLAINSVSTTPSSKVIAVSVLDINGNLLKNCSSSALDNSCNLPTLPGSGIYSIVVTPAQASAASFGLTLSKDLTGTLTPNGTATQFSITRPGQNGRYIFNATAGQNMSLVVSGSTLTGTWSNITINKPDGTPLATQSFDDGKTSGTAGNYVPLKNLPASGLYTVFVDPYRTSVGAASLQLTSDPPSSLAVDGAPLSVNLPTGQTGYYTFTGKTGQHLGLGISQLNVTPTDGFLFVTLRAPDGITQIASCGEPANSYPLTYTTPGGGCNFPPLPSDGAYTVEIVPKNKYSGGLYGANFVMTLSTDNSVSLTANASTASQFATTRVGQNARFSFNATEHQNFTLLWSGSTFAGSQNSISIYLPDGSLWPNPSAKFGDQASGLANGTLTLGNVPQSGVYTVYIDPASTATGSIGLQLLADLPGSLAIDGAPYTVHLQAGQKGAFTFSGTEGQTLGLGINALTTTPQGGTVLVSVGTCQITVDNNGGNCPISALSSTGTFTVQVDPGLNSADLTLTLSTDSKGTLTTDQAVKSYTSSNRVGQNARYTFNATAGQNLTVNWSGDTFTGGSSNLWILGPDGTPLDDQHYYPLQISPGVSGSYSKPYLTATGTYTAFFSPYKASIGAVNLSVGTGTGAQPTPESVNGTISVDGSPLILTNLAGNPSNVPLNYTFQGVLGQTVGLAATEISPSNGAASVGVSILATDNSTVIKSCHFSGAIYDGNCDIPPLPSTGTYTVAITTSGTNSVTMTMSNDVRGSIAVDAPATQIQISRVGQDAIYTFNGTAGQNLSWSASAGKTLSGVTWSGGVSIVQQDGQSVQPSLGADLFNLPSTGQYAMYIDGGNNFTGTINVALLHDAVGTVQVNGPAAAVNLTPGQQGVYTFNGTAGQIYNLAKASISTTPSGGSVGLTLIDPDGYEQSIGSCIYLSACSLGTLQKTGTYKVRVIPNCLCSASLSLYVSTTTPSALTQGAQPTTVSSSMPGQGIQYSFYGVSGQNLGLQWSNNTTGSGTIYVSLPYTSQQGQSQYFASIDNNSLANGILNMTNLPQTGTYTVSLSPSTTGSIGMQLVSDASGSLVVDGASKTVTLSSGQGGEYTFDGTAGQTLGLGISALSTSPAGGYVAVSLISPNDAVTQSGALPTISCGSYAAPGDGCTLPPLPATGTYTIRIAPQGNYSSTMTLTLSSDTAGSLSVNGSALSFQTTRPGQNARYSFNATQGGYYALKLGLGTGSFASGGDIHVYRPDGVEIATSTFSANKVSLYNLPSDGQYTVFLDPKSSNVGQLSVQLIGPATAQASSSDDADAPIPPWALIAMSLSLLAAMRGRQRLSH